MKYLKLAWNSYRGATILASVGVLLWIYAFYQQVAVQFYIGNQSVTAASFNNACTSLGAYMAPGSCAQALTDDRAKGHAFLLGILLVALAVLWAVRRFKRLDTQMENQNANH